jgi:class 3 adenylate cyclase
MTGNAPWGVVTFVFTDVEGSTRRWEADADAMRVEAAEPGRATAGIARLIRGRVVPRG